MERYPDTSPSWIDDADDDDLVSALAVIRLEAWNLALSCWPETGRTRVLAVARDEQRAILASPHDPSARLLHAWRAQLAICAYLAAL